jgi:hypothetical protein
MMLRISRGRVRRFEAIVNECSVIVVNVFAAVVDRVDSQTQKLGV